jgi:1,4-alpha-glucan branching enzyme
VQLLSKEMNHLYQASPALYERDFDSHGFEWIDCNDHQQSVLSFIRHSENEKLICIFNFTPVPRANYRIGLPESGRYVELINSDSEIFGGGNLGNGGRVYTDELAWMNQPASAEVNLPPLAVLVLKLEN